MDESKPVEMVRIPREEEYYDREQLFGRDVSSVFPNQAQDSNALDAIKEAIGAKKFISETELETLKAARGLTVEDGTLAADKPLAEVLRERKEAKEAAFQDKWRLMKQGKNRPLDEEELAFFDSLYEAERAQLEAQAAEEAEALAAYRAAVATARGAPPGEADSIPSTAAAGDGDAGFDALESGLPGSSSSASIRQPPQQQQQHAKASSTGKGVPAVTGAKRAPLSALVKVRPKAAAAAAVPGAPEQQQQQQQQQQKIGHTPEPQDKRQRLAVPAQQQQEDKHVDGEQGLAGLLGYGSDEDSG